MMTWEPCHDCDGAKMVKGKPCIRCTDARGNPTGKILYSLTGEKPPRRTAKPKCAAGTVDSASVVAEAAKGEIERLRADLARRDALLEQCVAARLASTRLAYG